MATAYTFVLVVCLCVIEASTSRLYGTYLYDRFGPFRSLDIVLLSRTTGAITNVTDNIEFIGQSEAFGVSSFDQVNGNYYFTTNYPSAGIFGTNVRTKRSLPVRFLDESIILSLAFDNIHGRLFVLHSTSKGLNVGILGSHSYRHLLVLPQIYNESALVSTVDGNSNTYYLAGNVLGSINGPFISSIDIGSGRITKQVAIDNSCAPYITYVHYNPATGRIVGGGFGIFHEGAELYFFLDIDPTTGACNSVYLDQGRGLIVRGWTFDTSTGILWLADDSSPAGAFLKGYNTLTGQSTGPVRVAGSGSVTSIEIDSSS